MEDDKLTFPITVSIPEEYVKDGIRECMICYGECMNPTIANGGLVGIDFDDLTLVRGEIFAFEIKGFRPPRQVKRVEEIYPGNGIILGTDNPSWPSYFVLEGHYKVLGRVKWIYNPINRQ
jgi:phage repressor protein C with HTH and peptisase S24 domain